MAGRRGNEKSPEDKADVYQAQCGNDGAQFIVVGMML